MKPGTTAKLKFLELKAALGLPKWQVMGLLESLWEFTTENCPEGDIGRFSPSQIALGLEFTENTPDTLINALIETRWLDRDTEGMVWVHNWGIHRPHFVTDRAELRYLRNIPRPCGYCEVEFHPTHERSKFCSPACRQANHRKKPQQITQCDAECNAVTHVTQSNANVTHSPVPVPITIKKEKAAPAAQPDFDQHPILKRQYKTLWADIKNAHPRVNPPETPEKHNKSWDVLSQIIRLDGISEARFMETWRWLFDSDDPSAEFWRGQVQGIEQLRNKKSGDTLNKFQKITEKYELSNKKGQTLSVEPTPLNRYTRFAIDRLDRIRANDWDFNPDNNPGEKAYLEYKAKGLCE